VIFNSRSAHRCVCLYRYYGVFSASIFLCNARQALKCLKGHPDREQFRVYSSDFQFTVCPLVPQNTNVTIASEFESRDSDFSSALRILPGAKLDMCKCKPGFVDRSAGKGRTCYACEKGKSAAGYGKASCIDCTAGNACGCSSTTSQVDHNNCSRLSWSPACSSCQPCPTSFFQNKDAKGYCSPCQDGFVCNRAGMTFPIATPGYWVSSNNPHNQRKCHPSEACPGSTLYRPSDGQIQDAPRNLQYCFTDKPRENQGEKNPCNELYGSSCAEGYAGEACGKCCKKNDKGTSGCSTGRMWFKTAGVRSPVCC
jgi:hypothetical protein